MTTLIPDLIFVNVTNHDIMASVRHHYLLLCMITQTEYEIVNHINIEQKLHSQDFRYTQVGISFPVA